MTKTIHEHEGSKYLRTIYSADGTDNSIRVDVYSILVAFRVTCPARAHALKKLLCCGSRGKGGELEDLLGVEAAVSRAIELQRHRDKQVADTVSVHSFPVKPDTMEQDVQDYPEYYDPKEYE